MTNAVSGGELRLRPQNLGSGTLRLNANAREGEIRAELIDETGQPMHGFTLADSEVITGDQLNAPLRWKGADLSKLTGRNLVVKLVLKGHVTVYSMDVAQ